MTSLSAIKAALKTPNATLYDLKRSNGILTTTDTLPNYPVANSRNMKLSYLQGASVNFSTNNNYLKVSVHQNEWGGGWGLTIFFPPKTYGLEISSSSTGYMINPNEAWVLGGSVSSLYFQGDFIHVRKLIQLNCSLFNSSSILIVQNSMDMIGGGMNDQIKTIKSVSYNSSLEGLPTRGIIGAYFAENFISSSYTGGIVGSTIYSGGGTWYDRSGNGNNATVNGSVYVSSDLNGKTYITAASTSTNVTFLNNNIPSNYLIAHVARYSSGSSSKQRIFTSTTTNWLSGFWNGQTGVAYHNGFIGGTTSTSLSDWAVSSDIPSSYWATTRNGDIVSDGGNGSPNPGDITINNAGETSMWDVAALVVYDLDVLGSTNRQYVHDCLTARYNIFKT